MNMILFYFIYEKLDLGIIISLKDWKEEEEKCNFFLS